MYNFGPQYNCNCKSLLLSSLSLSLPQHNVVLFCGTLINQIESALEIPIQSQQEIMSAAAAFQESHRPEGHTEAVLRLFFNWSPLTTTGGVNSPAQHQCCSLYNCSTDSEHNVFLCSSSAVVMSGNYPQLQIAIQFQYAIGFRL